MTARTIFVLLATVAVSAVLALPLGALVMPVALLLVTLGFFAIIPGAHELSGRLLTAGFALGAFGMLWGAIARQARAFLRVALDSPATVVLLVVGALTLAALLLATAWGRRPQSKPPTPRARPRARLLERPGEPPMKQQPAFVGDDELRLFGDRHG